MQARISEVIQALIQQRYPASICPSEVARAISSNESEWRALMPAVRQAAQALAQDGRLQITQRGRVLPPEQPLSGAIRLIARDAKDSAGKVPLPWTATRQAGLAQLREFIHSGASGIAYAKDRNFDRGPGAHLNVSRLSPYLRHRLIREDETLARVLQTESAGSAEKYIHEVCWRTYWKGWLEHQPQVWRRYVSRRDRPDALSAEQTLNLEALLAGRCGIDCMDAWLTELLDTGYLHNHARMWFASIWIFTLDLPWEMGADLFMRHLLDADPASNTLSWRWVAGLHTAGKHYLARAENIARYTSGRFNPAGLLNERALPLTEDALPANTLTENEQRTLRASKNEVVPTNFGLAFEQLPARSEQLRDRTVLVLHEDDLTPELLLSSFAPHQTIVALVAINTGTLRSAQALGRPALNFSNKAFDDAIERLTTRFKLSADAALRLPSPQMLAALFEDGGRFAGCSIMMTPPPVGPCRDALAPVTRKLSAQGVRVIGLQCDWDQRAWPHAKHGFFSFKTQIPQLIARLGPSKANAFERR